MKNYNWGREQDNLDLITDIQDVSSDIKLSFSPTTENTNKDNVTHTGVLLSVDKVGEQFAAKVLVGLTTFMPDGEGAEALTEYMDAFPGEEVNETLLDLARAALEEDGVFEMPVVPPEERVYLLGEMEGLTGSYSIGE